MSKDKSISELKLEISWYYVKELQKELWRLKGLVLLPIKEKIKNIIVDEKKLPEKFNKIKEFWRWKDIINFVTPSIAKKIFDFIREKKEEIAKKNTKDELIALKNEILWKLNNNEDTDTDSNKPSTTWNTWNSGNSSGGKPWEQENDENWWGLSSWTVWLITWSWWAVTVKAGEKGYIYLRNKREAKEIKEQMSWKKIRETISSILDATEKQKKTLLWQLSKKQISNIDEQIKNIRAMLNSGDFTDDWMAAFIAWQQFWDEMPQKMLDKMWHNRKNISKLTEIADEVAWIDNIDEMKALLKEKGITNLDDEFIKLLVKTNQADDIRWIVRIAWNASKAKNIAKTIWWAMVLDVAFFWVDVWAYIEARKEAELIEKVNEVRASNKYNQANWQLAIWAISMLAEIIVACTALWTAWWWPVWTVVWIAIWVITAAISMWVDSLYFDVKDFYLQNKEDFLREKHSQIIQGILAGLYNKTFWNTSINEHICEFFWWPEKSDRIKSTSDAIWAAIFLDEIENWEYKWDNELYAYVQSWKSLKDYRASIDNDSEKKEKFEKSREWISENINKRMEYCTSKESEIVQNISKCKWMKALDDIIVQSRVYAHISKNDEWDNNKNYETNLQEYKQKFFSDVDQEKLKKLEALKDSNRELFEEILITTDEECLIETEEEENLVPFNDESGDTQEENTDWTDEDKWDDTESGSWSDGEEKIPDYWEKDEYLRLKSYVKLVEKYKEWMKITETNEERINLNIPKINQHKDYIQNLFVNDLELNTLPDVALEGKEQAIYRFSEWFERNWILDVSDDPLYNVLYRLWKELYWYTWNNTPSELMWFYDENLGNNHWIYYSSKWKVNDDRAIDSGLIDNGMQWPFNSEEEINKFVEKFILTNFYVYDPETKQYVRKSTQDTAVENIDENLQTEFENKIRDIMKEELSYRLKDNVDSVKNEIINFVKNTYEEYSDFNEEDLSYISLPYYLVIKAKKAGLWDLQKTQFKRRRNEGKMEICRLPYDTFNKAIPFDKDKVITSYISSYRNLKDEKDNRLEWNELFTDEEKFFIDRVERAHQLIEDLRSCESWRIRNWKADEIDLPTEVEHLISDKYNERLRFKRNLLVRSPEFVNVKTIQQYEEFATYFENLYKWLLLMLSTFKLSNDVDSYSLFSAAVSRWNQVYFDDKWQLKTDTELEFLNNQENRQFFSDQLKIQRVKVKIWDKEKEMTIQELWDIQTPTDDSDMTKAEYESIKALALQANNTILTALLENSMLVRDEHWIKNVKIWGNWRDSDKNDAVDTLEARQKTQTLIEERLRPLRIPPKTIDKQQIKKNEKDQDIIELTEQEKDAISKAIEITNIIEKTLPDVDWQWKRWKITYDPERKVLTSRNNEAKVDVEEKDWKYIYYINHLKIWFEKVEDFVRMANFRNRVLYEDKTKNYDLPISFICDPDRPFSDQTFVRWTTTLIKRDNLIDHCSICKEDDNMQILASRLNREIKGDYGHIDFDDVWEHEF